MRPWCCGGALGLAMLAVGCQPDPRDMTPIGGPWFFHRSSGFIIEAGRLPTALYRDVSGTRVLVERDFWSHRYYDAQHCLIYKTKSKIGAEIVSAGCGDRPLLVVDPGSTRSWRLDDDGLRLKSGPQLRDGVPIEWFIPIDEIAQAAERGDRSAVRPHPVPVDVNFRNQERSHRTPLIDAVDPYSGGGTIEQRLAALRALLARGAQVNAADDRGVTALMLAAVRDDPAFIQPLLAAGASVDAQDSLGRTALMIAAESSRNQIEKVQMLLAAHADRGRRDSEGRTAAARLGPDADRELVRLLQP